MTDKKLKVLHVITKSNWGGAQRYVYDLAVGLPRDQFEAVVACGGTGELIPRLTDAGVRTLEIQSFQRDIAVGKDLASFFELVRIFRTERPDVVHLNSSKAGGIGAFAARIAGVPRIVFTAHGWAFNEPRPMLAKALIWLAHWITALLCHRVVSVSEYDRAQGVAMPLVSKKMVLIHNGIQHTELLPRDMAHREIFGKILPTDTLVIGTIAELHPNKGLSFGLQAVHELTQTSAPAIWGIIGDGEVRNSLLEETALLEIEKSVVFAGAKQNAAQYLSAFDIFLLPSVKEGLPYVLLEACMAQLPIIATSVGGVPEIIRDGETGLLVSPRDPEALTAAIKVLLENKQLRERLGEKAFESVSKNFSLDQMLKKTAEAYAKN